MLQTDATHRATSHTETRTEILPISTKNMAKSHPYYIWHICKRRWTHWSWSPRTRQTRLCSGKDVQGLNIAKLSKVMVVVSGPFDKFLQTLRSPVIDCTMKCLGLSAYLNAWLPMWKDQEIPEETQGLPVTSDLRLALVVISTDITSNKKTKRPVDCPVLSHQFWVLCKLLKSCTCPRAEAAQQGLSKESCFETPRWTPLKAPARSPHGPLWCSYEASCYPHGIAQPNAKSHPCRLCPSCNTAPTSRQRNDRPLLPWCCLGLTSHQRAACPPETWHFFLEGKCKSNFGGCFCVRCQEFLKGSLTWKTSVLRTCLC